MLKAITFTDIRDNEKSRRARLAQEKAQLDAQKKKDGALAPALEERLGQLNALLGKPVVDPVFVRAQELLMELTGRVVGDHVDGRLPSSKQGPVQKLTPEEFQLAAVYGLLQLDNENEPSARKFGPAVTRALGEYAARQELYDRVLRLLIEDDDISRQTFDANLNAPNLFLNAKQWVGVGRALHEDKVTADDSLLPLKVRVALAKVAGSSDGQPTSIVEINLPDLEEAVDVEIVADNLNAMQALYYTMVLEEMKLFQARDIALEQWQLGMIVTGRGRAGDLFYRMWRKTPDRFSELERLSLYSRCFGFAGGSAMHGQPNREFKTLWLRFLSAVSALIRQYSVDSLIRASLPAAIHQEQVRQSGRDLGANLSLHGFGIAYFAGAELQQEINDIIELFSDPEVKAAYAARDMYQVIEQIILFSGGQVESSVQKRVMANAGAVIIRWLAQNSRKLASNNLSTVLDIQSILTPLPAVPNHKPTVNPSDVDLVNAVEQWLAVNGIQDQFIEQNAQAMEPPRMPTRPIQMPSLARDVLESVGISAGYSGNGNGRFHVPPPVPIAQSQSSGNGYAGSYTNGSVRRERARA